MTPPNPKIFYLDAGSSRAFAAFHRADSAGSRRAPVLICPPWGWDEVASYRSRRQWAEALVAAGHPTLRFALPATGNSSGSPRDSGVVATWVGAVVAAARWLRAATGSPGVTVLGLGLGGLLARAALLEGAPIEELILWAAPVSGRVFSREARAFSRLQGWNGSLEGAPPGSALPEGWLEAGGFVLSAETLAELRDLDPAIEPGTAPRRALLLERDGVAVDEELRQGLERAGADVSVAPGPGWADLVSHAERTRLSAATAATVASWLAAGEPPPLAPAAEAVPVAGEIPSGGEEIELEIDGRRIRERPLFVEQGFGRAFGVLAEPAAGPATGVCTVFLNAGAVRNVGPNRLWVETARRWAAHGVRTLRLDLEGIGEADGAPPPTVCDFYLPKYQQQLATVLDRLQEIGTGERFALVGLCAGGYWAFQEGVDDPRVSSVLLLNSGALAWDPNLIAQREARKIRRGAQGHWRRRLLRGEVGLAKLWVLLRALPPAAAQSLRGLVAGRRGDLRREIELGLDRLDAAGTSVTLAFSAEEPLAGELESYGFLGELDRWPRVGVVSLPGSDHTLRPVGAQAAARELLDAELERLLR
jgi:alpha-beta hydrolase superfamily lysophospholipase